MDEKLRKQALKMFSYGVYILTSKFEDNLPLLAAVPAYLKCKVVAIIEKGDQPLFLAEVKNAVIQKTLIPLELRTTGWNYGG